MSNFSVSNDIPENTNSIADSTIPIASSTNTTNEPLIVSQQDDNIATLHQSIIFLDFFDGFYSYYFSH